MSNMNTLTKKRRLGKEDFLAGATSCVLVTSANITKVFADARQVGGGSGDGTIFSAIDGASGTILQQIVTTYNNLFPIAIAIIFVCMVLNSSNERFGQILNKALKIVIVVTIGINSLNLIVNTINWIVEKLGGSSDLAMILHNVTFLA